MGKNKLGRPIIKGRPTGDPPVNSRMWRESAGEEPGILWQVWSYFYEITGDAWSRPLEIEKKVREKIHK